MPEDSPGRVVEYRLDPHAAAQRARAMALVGVTVAATPAFLIVLLGVRARLLDFRAAALGALILSALGVARGALSYRRLVRGFATLVVRASDVDLEIVTRRGSWRIAPSEIARVVEIDGELGGLRIHIEAKRRDAPARVDVPRGSAGFAELRARIASWHPPSRAPKRSLVARVAVIVVIAAALFFVPFFVDDLAVRARVLIFAGLVAVVGIALALRRR